jgi:hypothetical protein
MSTCDEQRQEMPNLRFVQTHNLQVLNLGRNQECTRMLRVQLPLTSMRRRNCSQ